MGIWKINIERNYCVIAYAMPTHSVHSPIPFKGIPEPPLEVACLHASFFDGLRSGIKTEFMPKVQAVTAMTLDGFLPETDNVLMRWVMNHRKGFARWRERCDARILPHYIQTFFVKKTLKAIPLSTWQKFLMQKHWISCVASSITILWKNLLSTFFLIPPAKGIPYRPSFPSGNGSYTRPLSCLVASAV